MTRRSPWGEEQQTSGFSLFTPLLFNPTFQLLCLLSVLHLNRVLRPDIPDLVLLLDQSEFNKPLLSAL
jgi:hypothetical protein